MTNKKYSESIQLISMKKNNFKFVKIPANNFKLLQISENF